MAELDPITVIPDNGDPVVVAESTSPMIPRPRKVYGGMWGPLEIAAVAAAALVLVASIAVFFFWVVPSDRELARNISEADRLEAELASAKTKYGEITDTETQVAKIVTSVDDFESRFLPLESNGQTALYQRLNGLISAYGLVNTSGPDYSRLETADQGAQDQSDEEKGRAKFRSLYPGVYVSTTLEGSYQNLRRFIREIETGREFIIVSAVELAPSDTEGKRESSAPNPARLNPAAGNTAGSGFPPAMNQPFVQGQVSRPKGKTHGETVSLHIEMAAYFRRPNFSAASVEQ